MNILDSRPEIAKLDKSNMLGSIESLGKQVQHAWDETQSLSFIPTDQIRNVVVAGMGGSALGADVIKHLFKEVLAIPFDFVNSYTLPAFINQSTLVILSSYSGTTEEVLACAKQAEIAKAQVMVIAAGGDLENIAREKGYTFYRIDPVHNPSNQPRMAIGYSVFGLIGLLSKAGILNLENEDIQAVISTIEKIISENKVEVPAEENPAKTLAFTMLDRKPILIAAEFLTGAIHVASNQHNENGKVLVDFKAIPEINHHLMEGLRFPKSNSTNLVFIFLTSKLYDPRIQVRMGVTQKIVEQQEIDTMSLPMSSRTKIEQVFELIALFSFCSFYLSMLEGIDPSPIPFVDQFKEELKKYPLN